ncbi:SPASM domain-containing protein [Streptomyces sp. NPDC019531]|uniref:SPASM domain-containing protein n=1 Tax=Streptomyces sp. NPDC019531 TaxID=3365062 RepID=UPI00384F1300
MDYNGEVRACNFSRDSKKFGNLLEDQYDAIFGQKANFQFRNAPSPGGAECEGCSYYFYCSGCFVKAFMVSESEYPACPWRKKWFEGMSLSRDASPELPGRKLLPLLIQPTPPTPGHCGCSG